MFIEDIGDGFTFKPNNDPFADTVAENSGKVIALIPPIPTTDTDTGFSFISNTGDGKVIII